MNLSKILCEVKLDDQLNITKIINGQLLKKENNIGYGKEIHNAQ